MKENLQFSKKKYAPHHSNTASMSLHRRGGGLSSNYLIPPNGDIFAGNNPQEVEQELRETLAVKLQEERPDELYCEVPRTQLYSELDKVEASLITLPKVASLINLETSSLFFAY